MSKIDINRPVAAKFRVDYLRLIWLSVLYFSIPALLYVSRAFNFNSYEGLVLLCPFGIVPIGISIYRAILLLTNLDLEVLVFNDGFSYTNKGETKKYSWKEIDKVWVTNQQLLSIVYIKYIKIKILDTSGKILILDRTLQNVDKFEVILQEQIARDKFPQAITMLQQGMSLEFGGLTITKDHIKNSHDTILWSEFGDLQTWQGTIRLWKKGKQAISIIASIPSMPNFALLISLIRYLSKNAQTTSLPLQEIKKERNISPEKLQQAIALVKSGDKESEQKLLFEIISQDPDNEAAWLWLVDVVNASFALKRH